MSYWNPEEDGNLKFIHEVPLAREPSVHYIFDASCWLADQAIIFRNKWQVSGSGLFKDTRMIFCFTNPRDALLFKLAWG